MTIYVIVSASRNLGLAYVRQIAKDANNTVFALARDLGDAPDLISFANVHKNVHPLKLDLLDVNSIKEAAEAVTKATGGAVDVLIHNGAVMMHPLGRSTLDELTNSQELEDYMLLVFKANAVAAIHTINAFLPLILKGQTKKILVVTSHMGSPHWAIEAESERATAYSISKAALNMAVAKYSVTQKLREAGLIIVGVSPGFMKSHSWPGSDEWYQAELERIRKVDSTYTILEHDDSVRQQLDVLEKLTPADSGSLMGWDGKKFV